MPSIITGKFRIHNAEQFKEAFGEAAPSIVYLSIGKVSSWSSDTTPPTPTDDVANTGFQYWRDTVALKKIQSTDVSYVIPRVNWVANTVFQEYSQTDQTLYSNGTFYAMTSDYNVYKCLFNNGEANSTVEPSGTSTSIITTGDGYKWKYMYTISAADALKFVTDNYIPVKTLTADDGTAQWDVQQAATNGSIDVIKVTASGSGYNNYHTGTLSAVTNTTVVTLATGSSATDNFYNGSVIYITGGTGSGQVREVIDYVGSSKVLTVNTAFSTPLDGTSTYSIAPKVAITGDGSDATAVATVNASSNSIASIAVVNSGSGYSDATVAISANAGSSATASAIIAPYGGHGADPVEELGAYNVLVNVKLNTSESGTFTTANDFRRLMLVKAPLLANGSSANGSVYDQTTKLTYSGNTAAFSLDETISGGTSGATAKLVEANTTTLRITNISPAASFSNSEVITGGTSGANGTISAIANGSLKLYSGDILYVDNRTPVSRASDQLENIRLVIQF